MRIVFIGCLESSFLLLRELTEIPEANITGIVTRRSSSFNSDFKSLEPISDEEDIPCYVEANNRQGELAEWIQDCSPEVGYCFGWPHLLESEVLSVPQLGFVGYHPTKLPRNRGRHPIIWSLVLGMEETASTFFFMDERADSGDILSQKDVPIYFDDDARDLYDRLMSVAREQIGTFTTELANESYTRRPQDDSKANYWRKRSWKDGEIDWRMSSHSIYNLVRALARPYPGAHCTVDEGDVKIWDTEVVDQKFGNVGHIEPGKIIDVNLERIIVKCGEGVIAITEHEFEKNPKEGGYL